MICIWLIELQCNRVCTSWIYVKLFIMHFLSLPPNFQILVNYPKLQKLGVNYPQVKIIIWGTDHLTLIWPTCIIFRETPFDPNLTYMFYLPRDTIWPQSDLHVLSSVSYHLTPFWPTFCFIFREPPFDPSLAYMFYLQSVTIWP